MRVMLVNDQPLFRNGISSLLLASATISWLWASNGREALDKVPQVNPDIILMDIFMPEMGGLEAIENGDVDAAATELGHFIESATGAELIEAQEALKLLQAGDLHGAEDAIGEMLEISHN